MFISGWWRRTSGQYGDNNAQKGLVQNRLRRSLRNSEWHLNSFRTRNRWYHALIEDIMNILLYKKNIYTGYNVSAPVMMMTITAHVRFDTIHIPSMYSGTYSNRKSLFHSVYVTVFMNTWLISITDWTIHAIGNVRRYQGYKGWKHIHSKNSLLIVTECMPVVSGMK